MRRALTALTLPLLASLLVVGCHGTSGPASVKLTLTAPTDGATVAVSNLYAFGTVDPQRAAVVVAGRRVHVEHGAFRERVTLHRGLNHLRLVARAPGYLPTVMNLGVRSEPTPERSPAGGSALAAFREKMNGVCGELDAEITALGHISLAHFRTITERWFRQIKAVTPAPSAAGTWARYIETGDRQFSLLKEALRALEAHEQRRAEQLGAETRALQRTANALAASMGLEACVATIPNR